MGLCEKLAIAAFSALPEVRGSACCVFQHRADASRRLDFAGAEGIAYSAVITSQYTLYTRIGVRMAAGAAAIPRPVPCCAQHAVQLRAQPSSHYPDSCCRMPKATPTSRQRRVRRVEVHGVAVHTVAQPRRLGPCTASAVRHTAQQHTDLNARHRVQRPAVHVGPRGSHAPNHVSA